MLSTKTKLFLISIVAATIGLWSCGKDVSCRDFTLSKEYYWPPISVGDSVVFVSSSGARKKFIATGKTIFHRTKYNSSGGCGCYDKSSMLLSSAGDSLWFTLQQSYEKNDAATLREGVNLKLDGLISVFDERGMTDTTYTINGNAFTSVKEFKSALTSAKFVTTVYMAKNVGIIQYKMGSGEVWTNQKLTEGEQATVESFNYSEQACD